MLSACLYATDVSIDTTEPSVLVKICLGDDIGMTRRLLGRIIANPELTDKRLKRPTFRFIRDIVLAVTQATGFAASLYDEGTDHETDKSLKRDFLDRIIKVVGLQLYPLMQDSSKKESLPEWTQWWWLRNEVRPSMIVAGMKPEETNRFLQLLAVAAVHFSDSSAAVRVVRSSVVGEEPLVAPSTSMDNPETNGETVTLFVKMPNGQTAVLHDIAPSCDIEELHHLLQAVEQQGGGPSSLSPVPTNGSMSHGCQLQLVYSSKHMQPGRTVGDYNIQNGSTVFGLLRILGGDNPGEATNEAEQQSASVAEPSAEVIGAAGSTTLDLSLRVDQDQVQVAPEAESVVFAPTPSPTAPSLLGTAVLVPSPLATTAATEAATAEVAVGTAPVTAAEELAGTPVSGFVRTMRAKARAGRGQGDLVSSLREWVAAGCREGRALVSTWDHVPGALFCQEVPFVNKTKCDRWRHPPKLDGKNCKCKGDCAHAYAIGPVQPPPMPPALPRPLPIPPIETAIVEPEKPVAPGEVPERLPEICVDLIEPVDPPRFHPVYLALVNARDPEETEAGWYFNPGANALDDVMCSGYAYFINDAGNDALTSDEIDVVLKEWGMEDGIELLAETMKAWEGNFQGTLDFKLHETLNDWLKQNFHAEPKNRDALSAQKKRHLDLYDAQVRAVSASTEAQRVHRRWLTADKVGKITRAADIKRFERAWVAYNLNKDACEFAIHTERQAAIAIRENAQLYWRNATEFYGGQADFEGMMEVWTANEKARARLRKKWDKFKADICAYERAGFSWPNTEVAKPINPAEKKVLYKKEWTQQSKKSAFSQALVELANEVEMAQDQTRQLPEGAPKANIDTLYEIHRAQARAHTTEPRQLIDNIDDLGELSRRLDPHFQKVLSFWITGLGGHVVNRKKSKREMVQQLMTINYDGSRLCDILSGSVDFATPDGLKACLERIRTDDRVVLVDVQNYLDPSAPDKLAPDGTHQVWVYLTIVDAYTLRQVRVQAEDRLDGFVCELRFGLKVLEQGPGKHEVRMQEKWQSATKKRATKELLIASGLNAEANAMLIEGKTAQLKASESVENATKALLESNRLYDESIAASEDARKQLENGGGKYRDRLEAARIAAKAFEEAKSAIRCAVDEKEKVERQDKADAEEKRRLELEAAMKASIAAKLAATKLAESYHRKKQEEEDAQAAEDGMTDEERLAQEQERIAQRMEILKNIKAFRKFSEEKLRRAAEDLEEEEYGPGDIIIAQGDIGEEFFIIDKGYACVFVTKNLDPADPLANAKEVGRLKEKQPFGEVALLKNERRSASIVAGEDGLTALKMDKAMFKNIMENKGTKSGTWENGMVAKNKKNKDPNFPFTWWANPSQLPKLKLRPQTHVEANFKGKNVMMPGIITKTANGKYTVKYDSGEIETNVRYENITVTLVVNDRIAARYNGMKKYYSGKITRVGADGSYNVQYDDGEEEYAMRRDYIGVLTLAENRIDEFQAAQDAANEDGTGGDGDSKGEVKRELTREEQLELLYREEMKRVQDRVKRRQTRIQGGHGHGKLSMEEHLSLLGKMSPLGGSTHVDYDWTRLHRPIQELNEQ
jgi:hypothetical protein